ncbi:hypothetical protein DSM101010T_36590 [Desulfovibrio subterraneus]|uniref:Uncharacterized protein n=1 Tax=Desulfovibrio subterraneus TaxID=2718620 RepID=A0A7J0BQF2_9BACT|nr:hypothetical protein DSM101010T_36590 [Desulfovibrio subterraneus]
MQVFCRTGEIEPLGYGSEGSEQAQFHDFSFFSLLQTPALIANDDCSHRIKSLDAIGCNG